tara:strand:+ start:134 stop:358 length:225 start_codon:yes stop_codon:yes gene_type:complete
MSAYHRSRGATTTTAAAKDKQDSDIKTVISKELSQLYSEIRKLKDTINELNGEIRANVTKVLITKKVVVARMVT